MLNKTFQTLLLASAAIATAAITQAAELDVHGFASIAGGLTTSEERLPAGAQSQFVADRPNRGIYDDDLSFKPDTLLGLQISSDLSQELSITAQFTAAGGEDFDAEIQWFYLTYGLSDDLDLMAGKQRLPLFFYSDFLDVGYAYHWIRPPVETYNATNNTYEGVQLLYRFSNGDWDSRVQTYVGQAANESLSIDGDLNIDDLIGVVLYTNRDWLQLRATYVQGDAYFDNASRNGLPQDDNHPVSAYFWGVAAKADFDQLFIVTEYVTDVEEDPLAPDQSIGTEESRGWYISAGYRIGSLIPHITYAEFENDLSEEVASYITTQQEGNSSWTVGLRWDFHPAAAFKTEFTRSSDESGSEYRALKGKTGSVELFSFGVDLTF